MPASQSLQNAGLDWFRGLNASQEIALLTGAPANDQVTWAALPRANYTGYSDQTVTAATFWNNASGGTATNSTRVEWGLNTGGPSSSLTHFAVRTGAGNDYRWGTLDSAVTVGSGENAFADPGDLTLDDV